MSNASALAYTGWNPQQATRDLIEYASFEIADAAAAGYQMTLRQCYYRLVAANIIPNSDRSYQRLSDILTKARWAGLLPMDCLTDRGRQTTEGDMFHGPAHALRRLAEWYQSDRWSRYEWKVEVWCEKDALSSIFEPICLRYQVPYLACRGFVSTAAISDCRNRNSDHSLTVLYFGDHDPSGMSMSDDILERLIAAGIDTDGHDLRLWRIALNRNQIDEHDCPPQPAKLSDSRAADYIARHGDASWELDALPPAALAEMIERAITNELPDDWAEREAADIDVQTRLRQIADEWRR